MSIDVYRYSGLYTITKKGVVTNPEGEVMTQVDNGSGYLQIGLTKNKKRHKHYVHILVWESFNGKVPKGKEVDHIKEDRSNCELGNLRLLTRKQNMAKMIKKQYG